MHSKKRNNYPLPLWFGFSLVAFLIFQWVSPYVYAALFAYRAADTVDWAIKVSLIGYPMYAVIAFILLVLIHKVNKKEVTTALKLLLLPCLYIVFFILPIFVQEVF
ncbi:hypothetical protein MFMK1_003609 [Metallumcola ferriviriculae]|uniref:Uncharacterized protein n=1 Tax=Metallumcola ferriviriculae TaxID=3039180 RepID=A0AAU0USA9_9FIRM|nr:hypothetical protein MFMK1_003609 [Desulfitibacteraceae bacterium MK1]